MRRCRVVDERLIPYFYIFYRIFKPRISSGCSILERVCTLSEKGKKMLNFLSAEGVELSFIFCRSIEACRVVWGQGVMKRTRGFFTVGFCISDYRRVFKNLWYKFRVHEFISLKVNIYERRIIPLIVNIANSVY